MRVTEEQCLITVAYGINHRITRIIIRRSREDTKARRRGNVSTLLGDDRATHTERERERERDKSTG